MSTPARFTTRVLSVRTFPDFEKFFAQVHGCACTLLLFGRHLSAVPGSSAQRAERLGTAPDRSRQHFPHRDLRRTREVAAVEELVRKRQAHGILVYADGDPVGWCHFGRVDALPVPSAESSPDAIYARHASTEWVIGCFTTRMDFRRQKGVASHALRAAVAAIRRRGGGWIEAVPMAFPHDDPTLGQLRATYRWRSPEVADYLREHWPSQQVPGVGKVSGCLASTRTMGNMGTMSMFEKAGFTATQRDEIRGSDAYHPGDYVVMRMRV